jgi:hypothetical protein
VDTGDLWLLFHLEVSLALHSLLLLLLSLFSLETQGRLPFYLGFLGNHKGTLRNCIGLDYRAWWGISGEVAHGGPTRCSRLLLHSLGCLLDWLRWEMLTQYGR